MALRVELAGTLTLKPASGSATIEGTNGCQYGIANRVANRAPTKENSSATGSTASPASFVALPIHADMRGTFLQIQMTEASGPLDIQVTSVGSGVQVMLQVAGVFILEKPSTDAITGVAIQGTGNYQWALTGTTA